MTTEPAYPHLHKKAIAQLDLSDDERIRIIRSGSWVALEPARRALERMEELLNFPIVTRMPNLLLLGASFSGKTSIIEEFLRQHPPDLDPTAEVMRCPVVAVEAPYKPDITDFYCRILQALMCAYKPTAPARELNAQIKRLFRELGVRVLIVDEIHHLIAGSLNRQREFRNALKSLGNETKVCIVAAGIEDAQHAFFSDPQMSSRFVPMMLPTWREGEALGKLLATLEYRMPLRLPSDLASVEMMMEIDRRAEGPLGDVCDLVYSAGVDAIRTKAERITLAQLRKLDWTPPSKRKQYQRM